MGKQLLFVVFIFLINLAIGQQSGMPAPQISNVESNPMANFHQRWSPMMQKLFEQVKNENNYISHYVGAEVGSAYEDERFKKGKVYYGGEYLGSYYYRLNAFTDEIEVKRTQLIEEPFEALIKSKEIRLITADNMEMRYLTFTNRKEEVTNGYLVLLRKGNNASLYKRITAKFSEAVPAANSMVNPKPSRFIHFVEYYVQKEGIDHIKELPKKKSKFLQHFEGRDKSGLKDFLTREKVDLKDERDLIAVFDFLNAAE